MIMTHQWRNNNWEYNKIKLNCQSIKQEMVLNMKIIKVSMRMIILTSRSKEKYKLKDTTD